MDALVNLDPYICGYLPVSRRKEVTVSEQTIIALLAALFGGGGLKFIEHMLNRNKERTDLATQLREELRVEVNNLKEEVKDIDGSLESWKKKYYKLLTHYHKMRIACISAGVEIPDYDEEISEK